MINLNAYDVLEPNIKHWIWIPKRIMYLKDIKSRRFYSFLCRFDKDNNIYDYYLYLTDNEITTKDIKLHRVNKTTKGILKLYLSNIWDCLQINCNKQYLEINISLEEKSEEEEIYKIDFN